MLTRYHYVGRLNDSVNRIPFFEREAMDRVLRNHSHYWLAAAVEHDFGHDGSHLDLLNAAGNLIASR